MYVTGSQARWFQVLALALVTLAVPARSFAQVPTFNALVQTPVTVDSGFPEHATVGDINGDGKLDAMIPGINGLRVLLGNGNGTFVDQVLGIVDVTSSNVVNLHPNLVSHVAASPRPVGGTGDLKAVDMNRDGKLDLVGATVVGISFTNYSFVSVLINTGVNDANGVPQFTTTHHWMPFLGVRPVTVGDLNGDNWPDFIVGTCCNGIQVWTSNSGDGSFTPGQVFSLTPGAGGPSVGEGVITDLNGDGKADYVVASNQNGGANIFFGNGNGTLQTPGTYLPNHAFSLAVADVNGDGRPDLLMSNQASGLEGLYVYLNNGGGTFGSPTLFPMFGGGRVAVADINGDGKLDAALSVAYHGNNNVLFSNVAVLLGDGTGVFGQPVAFQATGIPTHVFVGDFTGDGKPDIGVVLRNSRSFGVLTNTTVIPVTCAAGSYLALPGDLTCSLAPAGSFVAASGATEATQCLAGTYSAVAGARSCTLAPAGSFVAAAGSASPTACPAGTYSALAGSASCALAPTGYFVASAGSVAPTPCAPGSYSDTVGAAACTPAPAGFFVPSPGASSATACAPGYGSAAGATSCYALDNDGDGVNNDVDAYPNSNMNPTVSVGTCGTSVANRVMPNGATFNDLIAAIGGANHGAKVSGVSQLSNGWKSAGLISGRDHGAIVSCTARSK